MATCYVQNGNDTAVEDSKYIPCDQNAVQNNQHTTCCQQGDTCLTNGLCRASDLTSSSNFAWKVGCTDPSFQDPSCPNYCEKAVTVVWKCLESETWCCNAGAPAPAPQRINHPNITCCSTPDLVFKAANMTVFTTAEPLQFSVSTLSSPTSAVTSLPNATASTTPAKATQTSKTASNSAGILAAEIILGIGFGLGVIALGTVIFFMLRGKKRKKDAEAAKQELHELPGENPKHELEGNAIVAEMGSGRRTVELEA